MAAKQIKIPHTCFSKLADTKTMSKGCAQLTLSNDQHEHLGLKERHWLKKKQGLFLKSYRSKRNQVTRTASVISHTVSGSKKRISLL
jgi:hypothetical protein